MKNIQIEIVYTKRKLIEPYYNIYHDSEILTKLDPSLKLFQKAILLNGSQYYGESYITEITNFNETEIYDFLLSTMHVSHAIHGSKLIKQKFGKCRIIQLLKLIPVRDVPLSDYTKFRENEIYQNQIL